jgi:gas vesicle protein
MSKGKFALGAIFGALAGVAAGVLAAPKSGKETRQDLKKKADELRGEADKLKDKYGEKVDAVIKDATATVSDLRTKTEKSVKDVRDNFKQ